jgi:cytochrome c-type biogenesis protein CcmH
MTRVLALILLLMGAGVAVAQVAPPPSTVGETFSDPALESRARHLQRQLRCLVCQGESIDESNATLAADLRRLVREQIAAGKSDQQIQDFLLARYGDFILLKPPVRPYTWLLWLAPFVVLAGAGGVAWMTIKKAAAREG